MSLTKALKLKKICLSVVAELSDITTTTYQHVPHHSWDREDILGRQTEVSLRVYCRAVVIRAFLKCPLRGALVMAHPGCHLVGGRVGEKTKYIFDVAKKIFWLQKIYIFNADMNKKNTFKSLQ